MHRSLTRLSAAEKNGALLSKQAVTGNAERVFFMKEADAEKVVGELVNGADRPDGP